MKKIKRFNIRYLFWKRCPLCGWWNSKKAKLCNCCDINLLMLLFLFIPLFTFSQEIGSINGVAVENINTVDGVGIAAVKEVAGVTKPSGSVDGYYLDFDGSSSIEVDESTTAFRIGSTTSCSFGCWAMLEEGSSSGWPISKWYKDDYWAIKILTTFAGVNAGFSDAEFTTILDQGAGGLDDGVWRHYVCVYDKTSGTVYLYIDGLLTDSGDISEMSDIGDITRLLKIGGGGFSNSNINVDEVFFTWSVLDGEQIYMIKGDGPADSVKGDAKSVCGESLELWYEFSTGSGTTVYDSNDNKWDDSFGGTCSFKAH